MYGQNYSDRIILVKVKADPVDLVLIQIYMPTTAHDDAEAEGLYEELEDQERECYRLRSNHGRLERSGR